MVCGRSSTRSSAPRGPPTRDRRLDVLAARGRGVPGLWPGAVEPVRDLDAHPRPRGVRRKQETTSCRRARRVATRPLCPRWSAGRPSPPARRPRQLLPAARADAPDGPALAASGRVIRAAAHSVVAANTTRNSPAASVRCIGTVGRVAARSVKSALGERSDVCPNQAAGLETRPFRSRPACRA